MSARVTAKEKTHQQDEGESLPGFDEMIRPFQHIALASNEVVKRVASLHH